MKSLDDYARDNDNRLKAMEKLNSMTQDMALAKKRLLKARGHLEKMSDAAAKDREEAETKAKEEFEAKMREIHLAYEKTVNAAKAEVGTAEAEMRKTTKKYQAALNRVQKLMPTEDLVEETEVSEGDVEYKPSDHEDLAEASPA